MQDPMLKCLHENHYSQLVYVLIQIAKRQDHIVNNFQNTIFTFRTSSQSLRFYRLLQLCVRRVTTYHKIQSLADELQSIAKLITIMINQLSFNPKINLKNMSIIAINNLINKIIRVKEIIGCGTITKIKQDFKDLLQKNSQNLNKYNAAEQQLIIEEPNQKISQKSKKQKKTEKQNLNGFCLIINKVGRNETLNCLYKTQQIKGLKELIIIKGYPKLRKILIFKYLQKQSNKCNITRKFSRFCVCDQAISNSGTTIITFSKLKYDWRIHIGICDRDLLIESKYYLNLANIGYNRNEILQGLILLIIKEIYFQLWILKTIINLNHLNFIIKTQLQQKLIQKKQQITWIKKQPNETFTIKFEIKKELYPCVKLWSLSKVELLNPILLQ